MLNLVTDKRRVARQFDNWLTGLRRVSVVCDGYTQIAGEHVRFRSLRGKGRTEFWIGRDEYAAVQINVPKNPRTEHGLSALAVDEDGNEFILRQGVLHKNRASGRVEPRAFQMATGLRPVKVALDGRTASRSWFVVTGVSTLDAAAIARNTADFALRCWVARGGPLQAPELRTLAPKDLPPSTGRVWVTSFWGFNPEGDGYLGFTREGDRAWFINQWLPGDLVMVYATKGMDTEAALRGRVMGFLEVEATLIRDVDRMSPEGRNWKIEAGVTNRWTHAVPVVRAWRATDLPLAHDIAPTTLGVGASWQLIASRGALLAPQEAARALSINLQPVDVFGKPLLSDEERGQVYAPSRGFPMSFGKRSFETSDGIHFLYALQLGADAAAVIGETPGSLNGQIVVKVGLAKQPEDRCAQHNACLPPAGKMRWRLLHCSSPLPDGNAALRTETALKQSFSRLYRSLGGEFFLCDEATLAAEFAKAMP